MKRVIITTCGTSLLSSSCWKYLNLNTEHRSQLDYEKRLKHELKCHKLLTEAAEKREDIAKTFDIESWENREYRRDLPAELASLRAIQIYFADIKKAPLGNDDQVLLLYSDDDEEGVFCVDQIFNVLTNNDLKKDLLQETQIYKWKVSGINPVRPKSFKAALEQIWDESFKKFNEKEEEYFLNLTAGYKAVVIVLGAFAYTNDKTTIFYLYEEANYNQISVTSFGPGFNTKGINDFHTECYILNDKEDDPGYDVGCWTK